MICSICGGREFIEQAVLWQGLIDEWQISPSEAGYIDRQQGTCCARCNSNLRSIALSSAVLEHAKFNCTLQELVGSQAAAHLRVLEINEAGSLHPWLKQLPGHVFGAYPEVDMHALPFGDGSFDLVVHSDTLEHVVNPIHALRECRRVLKPGGALCFTIPIIVGRMTRARAGLPPSYHGDPTTDTGDLLVHTEFGADAWTYIMEAGFTGARLFACGYPGGLAWTAYRGE